MTHARFPRLHPAQVCFVVDDVDSAVEECTTTFGWGPFHRFSAPVPEARYRDFSGPKKTEVALGMAGAVQVELIHVCEGRDTIGDYQSRYGTGFQHLGISCKDREQAMAALENIGATVDDQGEHPGIRFAFVDTPTGPGMFELLQTTGDTPAPGQEGASTAPDESAKKVKPSITLDRATIVTEDLDHAFAFYSQAFRWEDVEIELHTLRIGDSKQVLRRARGQAGQLLLELVEPSSRTGTAIETVDGLANDPYARQRVRGDHGLVHAGGIPTSGALPDGAALEGEWVEDGETFGLYNWAGGSESLQIRRSME